MGIDMDEPNARPGGASRKIKWLGIAVGAVLVLYTGVWAFLASQLESGTETAIAQAAAEGTQIVCEDADARGYPFRLGLHCAATGLATPEGASVTAGSFRSAAQIYDPGLVISEIDGPLAVEAPGTRIEASWDVARASTRFGTERLNDGRLNVTDVDVSATLDGAPFAARVARVFGTIRPNEGDLDAALTIDDLDVAPLEGRDAPPVDLFLDATLTGAASALAYDAPPLESLRGRELRLRSLDVALAGGGRIEVAGAVAVDGSGAANGTIEVAFSDIAATIDTLAALVPEMEGPLRTAGGLLGGSAGGGLLAGFLGGGSDGAGGTADGNGTADDGTAGDGERADAMTRATITIADGQARVGIIPLGRVPLLP